jgi:hypothetical protein
MNLLPPGMYGMTYGSGCVYDTSFSSASRTSLRVILRMQQANATQAESHGRAQAVQQATAEQRDSVPPRDTRHDAAQHARSARKRLDTVR